MMTRSSALLALLILLALPSAAQADMAVGFQGDGTIVDGQGIGREAALNLIQDGNGERVRIIIQERDWQRRHDQYRDTVAAIKARGLKVMVTLSRWRGADGTEHPGATVPEWRAFTASTVAQLAPYVDAWGTMNEPNHPAFAPHADERCQMDRGQSSHATVVRHGKRWIISYRRVKAGRGKFVRRLSYLRVRRVSGTHKRVRGRYVRAARGRYLRRVSFKRQRHGNYVRRLRPAKADTVYLSTEYEVRACVRQAWMVAYRGLHDAAAREIRAGDPTATVIVGDLAPNGEAVRDFAAMFDAAAGPVDADAVGIHPYVNGDDGWLTGDPRGQGDPNGFYLTTIESTVQRVRAWQAQGKLTGGQTWITEFGFRPSVPAVYWSASLDRAQAAGVPVAILYELTQHHADGHWDTGLLNRDGSPRPAWNAVKNWVAQ